MVRALWLAALILIAPAVLTAETRSIVVGRVLLEPRYQIYCITEPCPRKQPRAISQAWVFAEELVSGKRYSTLSGQNGVFRIRMPAGHYAISVPEIGALRRVRVKKGERRVLNLRVMAQ